MVLSPASVLNVLAIWGRYRLTAEVAYAAGDRHTLDVYQPAALRAPAPVVVFFYGGNWQEGDKSIYRFVGAALAGQGLVTVIPDYRVYPEVRYPGFLADGARAVRWVHDHAAEFGGDPQRIVLMGHSAGAYIAAMLLYDRQWLPAEKDSPGRSLRGLVGLAGPYDFLPLHSETLKVIFGPEDGLPATQPINYVSRNAPPAFLATGSADDVVDPGNATRLARRVAEKGGTAEVRVYDGIGHRLLIGAFSPPLRPLVPVLHDAMAFIRDVTAGPAAATPRLLTGSR